MCLYTACTGKVFPNLRDRGLMIYNVKPEPRPDLHLIWEWPRDDANLILERGGSIKYPAWLSSR